MSDGRRRWVDSDGLRLAVWEQGPPAGPTILLAHGYPDNASVWDAVTARLVDRYRVVRFDLRGHGESGAPSRPAYLIEHLVRDLIAVVRATGPAAPVHLVGHDWGSIMAWAAVGDPRHAALFASFTSISGPDLGQVREWLRAGLRDRRRRPAALGQLARSWYMALFQIPVLPELIWRLPWLRARFRADYRDARNGLLLYRANMFNRAGRVAPRPIRVPVLQIALTRDPYCRPTLLSAADPWVQRLWRRDLAAGHWAIRTHPDQIARFVREFVEHIEGRAEASL